MAGEKLPSLDKEKVETVKCLLSSLFARKQKFLIVDGTHKDRLVYANFPYERTIYYRPTPEDTLCGVTVNEKLVGILHEAFPIFDKIVGEISLMDFMSTMNKALASNKSEWPKIEVDNETDRLVMTIPPKAGSSDEEQKKVIGRLLPPDSLNYYDEIMKKFMSFASEKLEVDFNIPGGHFDDPVIYTDVVLPSKEPIRFRCPIKDGISLVSFKEYFKRRELPVKYKAVVQYRPESRLAKVAFHHLDDWVDCWSIMPGTCWFPFV